MRAFVTGMGAITAVGKNLEESWSSLLAGRHGIRRVTDFDPENFRTQIGAELPFDAVKIAAEVIPDIAVKNLIPSTQLAMIAAKSAINNAGLDPDTIDTTRAGICLGSGLGGIVIAEPAMRQVMSTEPYCKSKGIHPLTVPFVDPNFATSAVARAFHFLGPQYTVSTACSSSTHALGQALMMIQTGKADVILAGGMEVPIKPLTFACFDQMRAMSTKNDQPELGCRPFSAGRGGFVMGDAAGMMIIESEEHARARGAKPMAELCGYGASGGGYHMVKPLPDASDVVLSMSAALRDAGITPSEVDCINTHGTGTQLNDLSELQAIDTVFNDKPEKLLLMANKANVGHTLGAAGAIEAIFSVQAINSGQLPSFINYEADDALDYSKVHIPSEGSEKHPINCVLSNSFGFGNNNASIIFKGVDDNGNLN